VAFVVAQATLRAQVAPSLGTAAPFAVLGNSAVTGSAGSGTLINGSVGSYPTASISNFPPSRVGTGHTLHLTANATVQQAQADARTAYNALAAQAGTVINDNLSTNGALGPGVYTLGAADLPASTSMTLNGSGIFIFNVASTLTMNVGSQMLGTANPCNVYWRVGTSATLNGTSFMGTVLAQASITVGSGNVTGRVLGGLGATGAVTMSVGGNTIGGCSEPPPTIAKAFSPTSILAGGVSQLTITLSNSSSSSTTLSAAFTDTLPTGVVVATSPDASTTCGGAITATAGGSTVTLSSGSTVPAGSCTMSVNVTAAAAGSYVNTIPANALQTSHGNNAAPASATLTVTALPPGCPVITIAPATLTNGLVGQPYSQTLTASGGTAPYTFSLTAGTLPPGLVLSMVGGMGLISGTPTTNGANTFTIRVTDAANCPADRTYTMTITTSVPTMPEYFLMLLALMLATVGYFHLRQR